MYEHVELKPTPKQVKEIELTPMVLFGDDLRTHKLKRTVFLPVFSLLEILYRACTKESLYTL